jgi:hypothetical protein
MYLRVAIALMFISFSACTNSKLAGTRAAGSRELYDERTGDTLSVVSKPLVFARERTDVAAHARDYATLVAIETDRSGQYSDYLLLYRWSTVDRRMSAPPDAQAGHLRILTDGRTIDLTPLEEMPVSVSPQLYAPKRADDVIRAYRTDAATLRYLAMSRDLTVRMTQEALDTPFKIWVDGRTELGEFAARAAGNAR